MRQFHFKVYHFNASLTEEVPDLPKPKKLRLLAFRMFHKSWDGKISLNKHPLIACFYCSYQLIWNWSLRIQLLKVVAASSNTVWSHGYYYIRSPYVAIPVAQHCLECNKCSTNSCIYKLMSMINMPAQFRQIQHKYKKHIWFVLSLISNVIKLRWTTDNYKSRYTPKCIICAKSQNLLLAKHLKLRICF